jgi:hypothetical protein
VSIEGLAKTDIREGEPKSIAWEANLVKHRTENAGRLARNQPQAPISLKILPAAGLICAYFQGFQAQDKKFRPWCKMANTVRLRGACGWISHTTLKLEPRT